MDLPKSSRIMCTGGSCVWGSWDGVVVRALASHQCAPGSIPGPNVIIMWLKFVVGSLPYCGEVFLGVLRFVPLVNQRLLRATSWYE